MRLGSKQRDRIERGWAMTYIGGSGAGFYIESVLNVHDEPSEKYRGMVYVFGEDGDLVDRGEDTYEPFESLDDAKEWCDAFDAERAEGAGREDSVEGFEKLDGTQNGNLFDDLWDLFKEYGWDDVEARDLAVAAFEAAAAKAAE